MSGDVPHEEGNVRLAEIRRHAEASAEGLFGLVPRSFSDYDVEPVDERGQRQGELAGIREMFYRLEDADFFRHARKDVLALLDALEEAERRAERSELDR